MLSELQRKYFQKLKPDERRACIRALQIELDVIACSESAAAQKKRADYAERIAHMRQLGTK